MNGIPIPASHRGYFIAWRTDEFLELLRKKNAFLLLTLIAYRARWREGMSVDGLQKGQARLGRFDVQEALGLSPKQYRVALDWLERRGFIGTKRTHSETIATILDSRVFSITAPVEGTPKGKAGAQQRHSEDTAGATKKQVNRKNEDRGEDAIELPSHFPTNETEAAGHAAFVGCSEDLARQVWNEAAARGGRDCFGNPILSFSHHLAARAAKDRGRQAELRPTRARLRQTAPDHKQDFFHGTNL